MKLRITSGWLGGRYINLTEEKVLSFRPTLELVRKSVIQIISPFLNDSIIADVCAGSGIMGVEMISRGAKEAVFVERDTVLCKQLEKNIFNLNIQNRCKIIREDVKKFLASTKMLFDVIYYDPPYDDISLKGEILSLFNVLSENGVLLYERRRVKKEREPHFSESIIPYEMRRYGETEVCFFWKREKNR